MKRPVCAGKHIGMTHIKNSRQELTRATYSFYGRPSMCVYVVRSIKERYYKYLFCFFVLNH
jgi:hypothetical protein